MNFIKRLISMALVPLVMIFCFGAFSAEVYAETKTETIVTLDKKQDLTVSFTFDKEEPTISFVSPSGDTYSESKSSEEEFQSAHGDTWCTYKIINAEKGEWKVKYDKKSNTELNYSVVDAVEGLWIQSFTVDSVTGTTAKVSFEADKGDEEITYNYTISAVTDENSSGYKEVATGRAEAGEKASADVDLSELSSYSAYKLKLEVYYSDKVEVFDTAYSDEFSYTNPDTPEKISDYYMYVDQSAGNCRIDWADFKEYGRTYFVSAFADDNTDEPVFSGDIDDTSCEFAFPFETKKLTVNLYYRENGVLSDANTKEVDFENGEYLRLATDEVTSSAQATLNYNTTAQRTLSVTLGEDENAKASQFMINGTDTMGVTLEAGANKLYASFSSENNIFYIIEKDIYFDLYPPEIILYENPDGRSYSGDTVTVYGMVKNGNTLKINGESVTLDENGDFTYNAKLASGDNTITIEAADASGNTAVQSVACKKVGGFFSAKAVSSYVPLMISGTLSVIIIILAIIFLKSKKNTKAEGKKEKQKKTLRIKPLVWVLDVVLLLTEAASLYTYIVMRSESTSLDFVGQAEKSVEDAADFLRHQTFAGIYSIVIGAMLIVSVVATVLMVKRKQKKNKDKK